MQNLKVAMLGGRTSSVGLKAVGVEPYVVAVPEEGPATWESIPLERYAVVLVTEPVYEKLRESIPDFPAHEGLPVVLVIPAVTGSSGIGGSGVKKKVEKAVGTILE
jgi:vacuolar-type H+-ATPase subunit F/Vma7